MTTTTQREGKLYKLRSSAVRAAKEDGLETSQYTIKEYKKEFYYELNGNKTPIVPTKPDKKDLPGNGKVVKPKEKKPNLTDEEIDRDLARLTPDEILARDLEEARLAKIEEAKKAPPELEPVVLPPEPVLANPNQPLVRKIMDIPGVKPKTPKDDSKLHKSKIESPTKAVWEIADQMFKANPNTTRKQVMERCTNEGIAFYTARTQYQQWLTAQRESKLKK